MLLVLLLQLVLLARAFGCSLSGYLCSCSLIVTVPMNASLLAQKPPLSTLIGRSKFYIHLREAFAFRFIEGWWLADSFTLGVKRFLRRVL